MICSAKDCNYPVRAKGFCNAHYVRLRRYGDIREHIPLRKPRFWSKTLKTGCKYKRKSGYVMIYAPDYHKSHAGARCMVPEHRYVMAKHLGRKLREDEVVHHKNGIRDDNRIENLELWSKMHPSGQKIKDLVQYAKEILILYEPKSLKK